MGGGVAVLDAAVVAAAEQLAVGAEQGGADRDAARGGTGPGLLERDGEHGAGVASDRSESRTPSVRDGTSLTARADGPRHARGMLGRVPELPEVENARQVVEKALDRTIAGVDDTDEFVCRPHHPGEIDQALKGGRLVAAHRRGKTMWCDTVTADGGRGPAPRHPPRHGRPDLRHRPDGRRQQPLRRRRPARRRDAEEARRAPRQARVGPRHDHLRRRRRAAAVRQATPRPRAPRARRRRARPGRRRDHPRRVPGPRRQGHRRDQGEAARPVGARRRRQPARRRDAVAGEAPPVAPGGRALDRRARRPAPRPAQGHPRARSRTAASTPARSSRTAAKDDDVPPLRRADGARHRRWPDDVVVLGRTGRTETDHRRGTSPTARTTTFRRGRRMARARRTTTAPRTRCCGQVWRWRDVLRRDPHQELFHADVRGVLTQHRPGARRAPGVRRRRRPALRARAPVIVFRVPWVDDAGRVRVNRGFRVAVQLRARPVQGRPAVRAVARPRRRQVPRLRAGVQERADRPGHRRRQGRRRRRPEGAARRASSCGSASRSPPSWPATSGPRWTSPPATWASAPREIGWIFGQYQRLIGYHEPGAFTGKPAVLGGSALRPEATGYGAVYFTRRMLDEQGRDLDGARVVVSGSGNVALHAMDKVIASGGDRRRLLGLARRRSSEPDGVDVDLLREVKGQGGSVADYAEKRVGRDVLGRARRSRRSATSRCPARRRTRSAPTRRARSSTTGAGSSPRAPTAR